MSTGWIKHYFSERINSAANTIVTKGIFEMDSKLVEVLVTLRMNSTFMKYLIVKKRYHGSIHIIAGMINQINESDEFWSKIMYNIIHFCLRLICILGLN